MTDPIDAWPAHSFLEGLRPSPDEDVEVALLGSYSADLGSIGATLLALAGKDNDAGSGSPSNFADSIERLRGKVRIVIQRGRLAKMHRTPRIAAVLDQFVREVEFDEAVHSWHPKTALVQMRNKDAEVSWRLWIGSRNLTESVNRDIGILLVSDPKRGTTIDGVGDLAHALAEKADLNNIRTSTFVRNAAKVAWRAPPDVRVERIHWMGGALEKILSLPNLPPDLDELTIVSPFIDNRFLSNLTKDETTAVRSTLLTTVREIERIGPSLPPFGRLLAYGVPEYPVDDPEAEDENSESSIACASAFDDMEEVEVGLHAKLLFMRSKKIQRLWLGSANATMRAWSGRNVEVMAELIVTDKVGQGLKALLDRARIIEAPTEHQAIDLDAQEEIALERARAQVAARWAMKIVFHDQETLLVHESEPYPHGPHPDELDIKLEVSPLYGCLATWPPDRRILHFGPIPLAERSEFVRVRISREDKGLSWLQRAPAEPLIDAARDRAAFVRLLGAQGFLRWLAGLLADIDGQDGEDWKVSIDRKQVDVEEGSLLDPSLPTLEDMLAAWSRDPAKFREIEQRVSQYLPSVLKLARDEEPSASALLQRFEELWNMLNEGLDIGKAKGNRR